MQSNGSASPHNGRICRSTRVVICTNRVAGLEWADAKGLPFGASSSICIASSETMPSSNAAEQFVRRSASKMLDDQ